MSEDRFIIRVPEQKIKERLDSFLTREIPKLSRSRIQKLIKSNSVTVDGKKVKSNHIVHPSETIEVIVPKRPPAEILPEKIPLEIIFEDDHLIVVNKKAGMVVHPAFGHSTGTLVNALLGYSRSLSAINTLERPGIVHRLDKDTSGLLVVAKSDYIHQSLSKQFKEKTVGRTYEALVWGGFKNKAGTVSTQLARNKKDRKKISVSREGKAAITHYQVIEMYPLVTHLELNLETGRTHQIRVHLAHLGHPVFGDQTYGGRGRQMGGLNRERVVFVKELLASMPRQALHAKTLEFLHPISKEEMRFDSDLPEDMGNMLLRLTIAKKEFWK